MTKYTTIIAFILLLSGCSIKNSDLQQYNSSNVQAETSKSHTPVVLPSVADFPFVEALPVEQIVTLKEQIKNNRDIINNLSRNQVLNLLGAPVIIKKTTNLEIWQFRKSCILNIIWEKNTNKNIINLSVSDNIFNNTISNKRLYSIVWLEALTPSKKDLKPLECFVNLADID